jgi:amidase
MDSTEPLLDAGIAEVARQLRARRVSPVELLQAQLARIEQVDKHLSAYVTVSRERALEQALAAEREIASGHYRGPLHGIPYAAKDLIDTSGVRTTCGSAILKDHVPTRDATVIRRLRDAGAVLLGKLALTEFAGIGYHPSVTPPRNPWDARFWTGQSSSGSGVATAGVLCFAALGTDTGGSLRYPASACGVVGLRPTYGRVSRAGVFPLSASLDAIGPMARSAEDVALVLQAISGFDAEDPTSLRSNVPDYRQAPDGECIGARIGVVEDLIDEAEDPAVRAVVRSAVRDFESFGATIHAVRVRELDDAVGAWATIFTAECLVAHEPFFPTRAAEYSEALLRFLEQGSRVRGIDYARASMVRARTVCEIEDALTGADALLLPTMGRQPPSLEEFPSHGIIPDDSAGALLRYTAPFALAGYPAISIPAGFGPGGLPIGLQLVARRDDDATLLHIAHAYQCRTSWHRRRAPGVHAC